MMPPQQLDREDYLDHYFDYNDGEHLSLIYPTQKGKTHFAYQLLGSAMRQNPHLDIASLMPKPNSPATSRWAQALNLRETPVWPPQRKLFQADPDGYVLWPKHRTDIPAAENRAQVAEKFRKAMNQMYWKGRCICFADDVFVLAVLMGLNPECEQFWTAGGEGGAGLWSANQKPSGTVGSGSVSSFAYNSATHLFLGRDTDARNVKRFAEIGGGIDPEEVANIVRNLRLFKIGQKSISEVLYIDQRGPYMALIGP
jgi:hypothetical protein